MTRSFFLFFFIYAFSLYYLVPSSSATPIIGGLTDTYLDFKHHVSLHRTRFINQGPYEYFCGGSIFSEKHILTAASCFMDPFGYEVTNLDEKRPKIRAGTAQRERSGFERVIWRVFIPEAYLSRVDINADIAVVELCSDLDLSQNAHSMTKVRLRFLRPANDEGLRAMFPGFGATNINDHDTMAEIRQYLPVVLLSRRDCQGDNSVICANSLNSRDNRVRTACRGDKGGGLIVNNELVGVLNYGPENCDTNTVPIIFTRYLAWAGYIDSATNAARNRRGLHILSRSEEGCCHDSCNSRSDSPQQRRRN